MGRRVAIVTGAGEGIGLAISRRVQAQVVDGGGSVVGGMGEIER